MSEQGAGSPAAENGAAASLEARREEIMWQMHYALHDLAGELIAERMGTGESFDDAQQAVAEEMVRIFSASVNDAVMECLPPGTVEDDDE